MVSKLLKGRGLWLQVSCKSFPAVYSPLHRPGENDLQLLHGSGRIQSVVLSQFVFVFLHIQLHILLT